MKSTKGLLEPNFELDSLENPLVRTGIFTYARLLSRKNATDRRRALSGTAYGGIRHEISATDPIY